MTADGNKAGVRRPGATHLRRLTRDVRGLRRDLERAVEKAARTEYRLVTLDRALSAGGSGDLAAMVESILKGIARNRRQEAAMLRALAQGGVGKLEIRPRAKGAADVHIDNGRRISLTRREVNLLTVLAFAEVGDDGFPVFQTRDKVADQIGQKIGRRPRKGTINEIVRLVRKKLSGVESNPYFLDTGPLGLRFLLRRRS
jgi:hypothetical protein